MAVKAALLVRLVAGDVLVAESEDAALWQRVLAAIQRGADSSGTSGASGSSAAAAFDVLGGDTTRPKGAMSVKPGLGVEGFASELGVSVDELDGALSPSDVAPFIQLDAHCWEALKKNTPPRGPGSVSAIALAATVLALWLRHAGKDMVPKVADAQAVLGTIGLRDANAARGLNNTEWLQLRSGAIHINPAQRSRAIRIAAAFCTKKPISGGTDA